MSGQRDGPCAVATMISTSDQTRPCGGLLAAVAHDAHGTTGALIVVATCHYTAHTGVVLDLIAVEALESEVLLGCQQQADGAFPRGRGREGRRWG